MKKTDLKRIIAYTSVAHMNFALLGLFRNNTQGIEGSLFFMLGHGVISSALFLCIGMLYDPYNTRNILSLIIIISFLDMLYISVLI